MKMNSVRVAGRGILDLRVVALVLMFGILSGCGKSTEDVAAIPETHRASGVDPDEEVPERPSCKEYVVQKAAAGCVEILKSRFDGGPDEVEIQGPEGHCDGSGFIPAISGKASEYVDNDKLAIAHFQGSVIDWDEVVGSCGVGARVEAESVCASGNYGC